MPIIHGMTTGTTRKWVLPKATVSIKLSECLYTIGKKLLVQFEDDNKCAIVVIKDGQIVPQVRFVNYHNFFSCPSTVGIMPHLPQCLLCIVVWLHLALIRGRRHYYKEAFNRGNTVLKMSELPLLGGFSSVLDLGCVSELHVRMWMLSD